jgi:hypothetical protein
MRHEPIDYLASPASGNAERAAAADDEGFQFLCRLIAGDRGVDDRSQDPIE